MSRQLPAPPDAGVVNALRFGTQTFRFLEGIQSRFEDGTAVTVPGKGSLVILTNPALIGEALSRPGDFPRVETLDSAAMIAEGGLVQSEGDLWEQQRSIIGPAFGGPQVTTYADTTGRRVDNLADRWAEAGHQQLNLHRETTGLTIRAASSVLLGEDIGKAQADQFHEWMEAAGREFEFGYEIAMPEWVPTPTSRTFGRAADGIRSLSEELIATRRVELAEGADPERMDMLTLLLRGEDDPEVDYPPNQIRDEVSTFLIAGHETTALSITYTLALLSWNPKTRRRVREEAEAVLGDGPPQYGDISGLEYTNRVYREALRLYPPAWAVFRRTDDPTTVGSYRLPGNSAVILPQWSVHRDERYFENPEAFDPDRWERRGPSEVEAYFPFSKGPHACIGQGFARAGATLVIARLVRDFDIEIDETALDDLRVTPTLRPTEGVSATVKPIE